MSITLSDHDKEIIRMVDSQVKLLLERKTQDHIIISTLIDFIPEVRCMVSSTCESQFHLYCEEYQHFNYFLQLINQFSKD
ncbi:hypothetical protein [Legionella hackeliae]|uniref:Uncharacterized protein n=1 Tax=Legionella hackeliae TaxID=449 RepID=A0A0A8USF6_LEGHA|nr:hypothetical protein [Legionella hackeliae]KTD09893.1 hypothetical protein Lhac_2261 [Legionella hackeliae]CEK11805.1 conserved protein of unknown function [Legionella hackeliae]STX48575.1 Uncharacterised protein [Legionella hackeliae]